MLHAVAIIGLGVMGQRMLGSMAVNGQFNAVSAWDPDADARAHTRALYPEIRIADSPEDAISGQDTGVVYIACPPVWHKEHAIAAIKAGHVFYTVSPSTGREATVLVVACGHCGREIIRSSADAVMDNNLDSLRRCGKFN